MVKQWRQQLLDLKEKVKQKMFDSNRALTISQKIKDEYKNNLVMPNSDILNAHMQLCDNLEQANYILTQYRVDNVPLTTTTFNIFISLSPDLSTAYSYFNQIFDIRLKPNAYTFNGLISKCMTFQQGKEILMTLNKYEVLPNTQTFNTLLSLTRLEEERREIIKTMEDGQIEINLVTYNTLISLSTDFRHSLNLYNELRSRKIKPTINTFVTLLKKTSNEKEINEVECILKNEGIQTNYNWDKQLKTKKYRR